MKNSNIPVDLLQMAALVLRCCCNATASVSKLPPLVIGNVNPLAYAAHMRYVSNGSKDRCAGDEEKKENKSILSTVTGHYERFLQQRYPRVYKVHRNIVDGSKQCLQDLKLYYVVTRDLRLGKRSIQSLNRAELEVLIQVPPELIRLAVITVLVPAPFGFYVIAFGIVFFPRLVLTRHFWSKRDKEMVWLSNLETRGKHHAPLISALKQNGMFHEKLSVSQLKPRLLSQDVNLPQFDRMHFLSQIHLCRSHGILPVYNWGKRLSRRMLAIQAYDFLMRNETSSMTTTDLHMQMYMRQLSYAGKGDEEMKTELNWWMDFSSDSRAKESVSLLAHAPVLLEP